MATAAITSAAEDGDADVEPIGQPRRDVLGSL